MNNRTRYFITASTLIMVAALCTGLVAYYSGGLPLMASRTAANDDLAYVPADSTVVAYANVRDIMNSEFRQKLRTVMPTGEGRNEFLDETGIDLERDVTSVVAAMSGAPDVSKGPEENTVILIRGVFNQSQIQASAVQRGATVSDYKGKQVISAKEGNAGVAFLEPGLAAVGGQNALHRAIDARSGANVTSNTEVMRLIGGVDPNANAWAVGRVDQMSSQTASLPDAVKNQLSAVQWFSVTGHVNGGVTGTIKAEARDDQAAENLRAVINGGLALARLQMGHDAKLDAVINSLQMSGTGKSVGLSFSLSSDVLDLISGGAGAAGLANIHKQFK